MVRCSKQDDRGNNCFKPDEGFITKAMAVSGEMNETEQDLMVLGAPLPATPMSSTCLLSVENCNQRKSLIREMRTCRNKGKQSKETK